MAQHPRSANGIANLRAILNLEPLDDNRFRGRSPDDGWQRVFGGQVIGQALVAASRTVEPSRPPHSLHAYFLLPGDPSQPIDYEVDRLRDGGSFTTRRVVARQSSGAIFAMSASFQGYEEGFAHQITMPEAPAPESLPSEAELKHTFMAKLPDAMRRYWERDRPIEMRPVDFTRFVARAPRPASQMIWLRATAPLGDDPALHQCALAYASDFTLLDTALIAHGRVLFDPKLMLASLDHALWFHRPFRADDWLLYVQDSPSTHNARGFCRGQMFTRDGVLIASVAQEGLIRQRRSD